MRRLWFAVLCAFAAGLWAFTPAGQRFTDELELTVKHAAAIAQVYWEERR